MNDDYRQAYEAALRSAALRPADANLARDTINRLRMFNLGEALVGYVERLGPVDRIPIPLLLAIAGNFSVLNEQRRALRYLDEAVRGDPDYPPSLLLRAQVLLYLGRKSESRRDLMRCMQRAPEIAQAHWLRSMLGGPAGEDGYIRGLQDRLQRAAKPADAAFLGFALHRVLDGAGEVDGAWKALERACRAKRGTLQYAAADSERLVDALVAWRPADPAVRQDAPATSGGRPVFIVGMHRSGTTLLEQLLDASPQVRSLGELYDFTGAMRYATNHHCRGVADTVIVERARTADLEEAGQRYLRGLAWRLGKESCFTDKLPSNFLNIGFICRALPQARILHMVRDPLETCFSNLRELFSDACPYSYDQAELAGYYLQYRRLMAHWHGMFPRRILDVDYARLTADPAAVMREVAQFCGIEYVDAMRSTASSSRAVATASAMQVRGEVVRREVPKWEPYRQYLQPLAEALRQGGVALPE